MTDSGSLPPKPAAASLSLAGPGLASAKKRTALPLDRPGASDYLLQALHCKDFARKRELAEKGLECHEETEDDDDELKALLLRQVYLSALDAGAHDEAYDLALCMVDLAELGDIARQDAARAALALGRLDDALEHIRIAARVCPDNRRSFHYGHLGALLRFSGQLDQSVEAFTQATVYAGEDVTLYQAQRALAEAERSGNVANLAQLRAQLEAELPQKGYGQWILGELCCLLGDYSAATQYLRRFLERLEEAPRAKCLSLRGEIAHARNLLKKTSA